MQYKTLKLLMLAYEFGELTKDNPLILDNDSTRCYEYTEAGYASKVFDGGNPNQLLREALTLLGIPWEEA